MAAFRVLAVCTGNICRSPMIERLLSAKLQHTLGATAADVEVSSAGTWGHEGAPMEPFAAACLTELGGDPTGFVARELDAAMTSGADLVLAATREHRAAAVTMAPSAVRRCFTLLEFARLLQPIKPGDIAPGPLPERMRDLVDAAAGNRGLIRPERPNHDDIDDPYGAPQRVFSRVAGVIETALVVPVELLAG